VVRIAAQAAYLIAIAGLVALVAIGLFFAGPAAFGPVNDLALLVMTLALAPVMLAFYELGGRTPIGLARLALTSGIAAVVGWSVLQALMIGGAVSFDYERGATGAFAAAAIAVLVVGMWLAGANLLAGAWLLPLARWLGVVAGIGFILFGLGLLVGGVSHPLTYAGGIGYQILFPIWGLVLGRLLTAIGERRALAA
jgi:hypothetical protein